MLLVFGTKGFTSDQLAYLYYPAFKYYCPSIDAGFSDIQYCAKVLNHPSLLDKLLGNWVKVQLFIETCPNMEVHKVKTESIQFKLGSQYLI